MLNATYYDPAGRMEGVMGELGISIPGVDWIVDAAKDAGKTVLNVIKEGATNACGIASVVPAGVHTYTDTAKVACGIAQGTGLLPTPSWAAQFVPGQQSFVAGQAPKFTPPQAGGKYVARYHKSKKVWSVYQLAGALGYGGALGEAVTPPAPGMKVGEVPDPVGVTAPTGTTNAGTEDHPFYKKWWFWAAIGGGVAAVGTGAYLVMR
jgi:hypothetical protein